MDATARNMTVEEKVQAALAGAGASRVGEYEISPYALVVSVTVPETLWAGVWYSWLSLKGHLASLHFVESSYSFASRTGDQMHVIFIITWTSADAISAWFEQGFAMDDMLRSMGVPDAAIEVELMRDFS